MNKLKIVRFVSLFLIIFIFYSNSVFATGFGFGKSKEEHGAKIMEIFKAICNYRIKLNQKYPRIPVPKICKSPTPEPKPAILEFNGSPLTINEGESATLSWASENALSCEASGSWSGEKTLTGEEVVSPVINSTYTLTCDGTDGGVEKSVIVEVTPLPPPPPPEPTIDHVVLSEFYYLGTNTNEWIEIYNGTGSEVSIDGWTISDGNSSDVIPTFTLSNNSFAIITGSTTLSSFLTIPVGVQVITLANTSIGSGLNDTGDLLSLKNSTAIEVDAVSYGNNTTAFNPSVPTVSAGHSISRVSLNTDNNNASDWQDLTLPTPGTF